MIIDGLKLHRLPRPSSDQIELNNALHDRRNRKQYSKNGGLRVYQGMTLGIQCSLSAWQCRSVAVLRPVSYSPLPYRSPINLSTRNHFLIRTTAHSPLHVSLSTYGVLVFQSDLQLPTHSHQCFGPIQEAHKERLTQTSPRLKASILQLSQCYSCCSSAAAPRARSVPKERRAVDTMA